MKLTHLLAGAVVVGAAIWAFRRVSAAKRSGLSATWAIVNPTAPIIPPAYQQAKSGAGHF